jgi:thiol-disulfide isomerase/thioredoxin
MAINVPQSVFDKYYEVIDSTFTIFGVTCQLVTVTLEEISHDTNNNVPDRNSVNVHRRRDDQFDRGTKTYREVETLEDIVLKVYWDNRSFVKVGNINIPDNAIQTIGKMDDLPKILNATQLIVHKEIKDHGELRFERSGEHFPMGLKLNKYFGCFWKRVG